MSSIQSKLLYIVLSFLAIICAFWFSGLIFVGHTKIFPITEIRPWSIFQFFEIFWEFNSQKSILIFSAIAPWIVPIVIFTVSTKKNNKKPFGSVSWAKKTNIQKARLYENQGIIIGQYKEKLLTIDEPCHALLTAPTRSGKGIGIVIPNLLFWQGSVIVLDIKQENHAITSGYRATLGKTFLFSPMQQHTHCYNPLDLVRENPIEQVSDIQQIANFLVPMPENGDPMWASEARNLFLGIALYVLYNQDIPSTIGEIYRTLNSNVGLGDLCKHLIEKYPDLPPACIMALSNFHNKASKEQSGVKSNLSAALNLWANPAIDTATSQSDFHLETLRKTRQAIYVGVSFSQITTLRPLLSLLFQQTIDVLSRHLPKKNEPHKVLMLIDEFPALGYMSVIADSLPVMAGYGIRMFNICQGLSYLDKHYHYTGREGFLQNSAVQIFYAPNDEVTAKFISNKLGQDTIEINNTSKQRSNRLFQTNASSCSESKTLTSRPFLLAQEARNFGVNNSIVFLENNPPIKGEKITYYNDVRFKAKLLTADAVPQQTLVIKKPPIFDIKQTEDSIMTLEDAEAIGALL